MAQVRRLLRAARFVLRGGVAAGVMVLGLSARAEAQASPYLPLDDIGYAHIDALQARGELRSLSMLERPYTISEIEAALLSSATATSTILESWRSALRGAMAKYDPHDGACDSACRVFRAGELAVRASVGAFAAGRTTGIRELMLADERQGVYPGFAGRFTASAGPFVAASRALLDDHYKDDPFFRGKKDRALAGRVEDAYLGVSVRWVELAVGRVARSLGPAGMQGLQIGHAAYTYDHLFARLGSRRFHLVTMIASLDAMPVGDSVANRYMAFHRLSGRWGGLEVAVSEAMSFGGVGRRFEPGFLNPLNVYQLTQYNEDADGNVSYGIEAAWRSAGAMRLSGQLLIDDFQIDDCTPNCEEPSSYGLTLAADGLPLAGMQKWFVSYARVSNLTYRTPAPYEAWMSQGIGLGHGYSDYDELRAGLDLALLRRVTVRPYVAYRRQGEGDYRAPFPLPAEYATTPEIHAGVVDRTARLALSGSWSPSRFIEVRGDVGWNRSEDRWNVEGDNRSGVHGWVRVALESPWIVRARLSPE